MCAWVIMTPTTQRWSITSRLARRLRESDQRYIDGIIENGRNLCYEGRFHPKYLVDCRNWPNFKSNFKFVQIMSKQLISRTLASHITDVFRVLPIVTLTGRASLARPHYAVSCSPTYTTSVWRMPTRWPRCRPTPRRSVGGDLKSPTPS